MHNLKSILFSNLFLALLIALPIAFSIRGIHKKYTAKTELIESFDQAHQIQFNDLDGDGNSEKIVLLDNQKGNGGLKNYNPAFVGQFNSNNELIPEKGFSTGDYDDDGIKEVYFLGIRNDSIFLNQFEKKTELISSFFIDTIQKNADIKGYVEKFSDLNKDGFKEAIFEINAGYALVPRKIYAFDFVTKNVIHTPLVGAKVGVQHLFDLDQDGNPEIICACPSPKNYGDRPVPYSDIYSWLMVFNHELHFKFEPIKFSNKNVTTKVTPFTMHEKNYLLCTHIVRKSLTSPLNYFIVDPLGNSIHSDSICYSNARKIDYLFRNTIFLQNKKNTFYFIDFEGNVYKLSKTFAFTKSHRIKDLDYSNYRFSKDINGDGKQEFIFQPYRQNKYIIFDHNLKNRVDIDFTSDPNMDDVFSIRYQKGKKPTFIVKKGFNIYEISYRKNIFWQWRFVIFLLIYLFAFGFLKTLQHIQRQQVMTSIKTKQNIRELQFKLVTAQLNPHFTFNALNSVSKMVYDAENPEAYDLFTSFSRLIRTTLTDTDSIARPLSDELKLTADFVKIQQQRFKDAFSYAVNIDKKVNLNTPIPKMIIQLFVENCIKHAFPFQKGNDQIDIEIFQQSDMVYIDIIDNGIGRKAAQNRPKSPAITSTGIGIRVMDQFVSMLNKNNSRKIEIKIIDRIEKENTPGTRVKVTVPLGYRFG